MNTQGHTDDFSILTLLRTMPFAILLWIMLWANINSGPWYLKNHHGILGHIHAICALLPFLALIIACLIVVFREDFSGFSWSSPVRLMALYGLIGIGASKLSPNPMSALYWGSLYMSVFVVLESFISKPDLLRRAYQLVIANWCIVAIYALALAVVGRHEMFGQGMELIGYGIFHRIPTVMEMPMSRASGIGRFAAIPAVIAFSRMLHGRGIWRFFWIIPFTFFTAIVITMQSRGAVFGYATAICVVLLLHRANVKMIFLIVFIIISAIQIDKSIPDRTVKYIYRGQDRVEFLTLTGRTHTWEKGWELFKDSPLVGFGPQADRYSLQGEHMHNAYLYALTQSGLIGTIPFVAAWLMAWFQLSRIIPKKNELPNQQWILLVESGAVLVFFTARSIPEASAAFFGVDLLILVPVLAYINILYTRFKTHDLAFREQQPKSSIQPLKISSDFAD